MYRQPAYRVRSPPAITPTVAPPAPSPPQIPRALLRSAPSRNMFITIERAAGSMIAAPMPWTARAPIMNPTPVASAAASDATVNSPRPTIRMRRRPSRSAARPPSSKNPPKVSAYAVTTHCRLVWEKCRSRPIVGSETLTIVRSMTVMKNDKASSANARQRLIWDDCDVNWTSGGFRRPVLAASKKTSHHRARFGQPGEKTGVGQPSVGVERRKAPLQLSAFDLVGAERDRSLVRAGGGHGIAGSPEQVRVRGVQRLVALECSVGQQRLKQLEPGLWSDGEPDRRRAVQLDDRRGRDLAQRAVQLRYLLPIGCARVRPADVQGGDRGLQLVLARVPEPHCPVKHLKAFAEPLAIPPRTILLLERDVAPVRRDARIPTGVVQEHQRQ